MTRQLLCYAVSFIYKQCQAPSHAWQLLQRGFLRHNSASIGLFWRKKRRGIFRRAHRMVWGMTTHQHHFSTTFAAQLTNLINIHQHLQYAQDIGAINCTPQLLHQQNQVHTVVNMHMETDHLCSKQKKRKRNSKHHSHRQMVPFVRA